MSAARARERLASGAITLALVLAACIVAGPLAAEAPPAGKMPRVGVLSFTQLTPALPDAFRQGLREHGYVEGTNIAVEWRAAEGQADPGGNITGMTAISAELSGKRLQLVRELVSPLARVGLLVNGSNPFAKSRIHETQAAAQTLGIQLLVTDVRRPEDLEPAMSGLTRQHAGAEGGEPGRPPGGATDHVRADRQPQDRQSPRPDDPCVPARASRPGDRVRTPWTTLPI